MPKIHGFLPNCITHSEFALYLPRFLVNKLNFKTFTQLLNWIWTTMNRNYTAKGLFNLFDHPENVMLSTVA